MKSVFVIIGMLVSLSVSAADKFVLFSKGDVCLTNQQGEIVCDATDWKGVLRAVEDLKEDLRRVTGRSDYPITIGTLGRSKAIDKMAKKHPWLKSELSGKWEKFVITIGDEGIVIAGSDRRGTIYGIYELSEQLGVSPWYWWADVPIVKREKVFLRKGFFTDGEPAVKYRGIFINDEWPSFGGWASKHFGGINSKMYAHMFELLLRLAQKCSTTCAGFPSVWAIFPKESIH